MNRLEALGFGSLSRTSVWSGIVFFIYFFLLNFLLISRDAGALFEFPYVFLLVLPYFLLATSSPLMGLGVYIIYLATRVKSLAPSYGGILTLSTLLNMGLIIGLVLYWVRHRTISRLKNSLSILVYIYIGCYFLNALFRKNPAGTSGISVRASLLMLLLFVCTVLFIDSQQKLIQMLRVYILLGLTWSGLTVYHVFIYGTESLYARTGVEGGYLENIIDANSLAVSTLIIFPLLYFLTTLKQRRIWQVLAATAAALSIVTVILTFSRNGFINLVVVLALIFQRDKKSPRLWAMVFALLAIVAFTPQRYWMRVLSSSGGHSYQSDMGEAIKVKLTYVQNGIQVIKNNPLFGVGRGRLERSVHNSIVQVAVEMGLVVMVLFLAILVCAYRELKRMRADPRAGPHSGPSSLPYMLTVSLVAYVIGGLTISIQWYFPLFLILGMIAAMKTMDTRAALAS